MSTLSITITEQPTEYHRFRYETEVTGGKLGGLLYGRHGNKSSVRVRVSGIDPQVHSAIIVVGGTVNPDGFPHPFFMVGENCSDGVFKYKKQVSTLDDKRELEIALERVSLVCVSTREGRLEEALARRKQIDFNPCRKDIGLVKYNTRNLKSVRLAFQLYYVDFCSNTVPTNAIAQSDVILDDSSKVKLNIHNINPSTMYESLAQDVWLYFDDELPHTDKNLYSVTVSSAEQPSMGLVSCTVLNVRKHLLVISIPDFRHRLVSANERVKCFIEVADDKSGQTSNPHDFVLVVPPPAGAYEFHGVGYAAGNSATDMPPPGKRKRAQNYQAQQTTEDLGDLQMFQH